MAFFAGQIVTAALLNAEQEGSVNVSFASGDAEKTATVTFDTEFADTPNIQVALLESGGGTFGAVLSARSSTGFTVHVFVTTGVDATAAHTVTVMWRAKP